MAQDALQGQPSPQPALAPNGPVSILSPGLSLDYHFILNRAVETKHSFCGMSSLQFLIVTLIVSVFGSRAQLALPAQFMDTQITDFLSGP